MIIVGFMGQRGAGKDTAAAMARQHFKRHGYKVCSNAFATPLKKLCSKMYEKVYGVDPIYFYGNKEQKEAPLAEYGLDTTGREILQSVGTQGFRRATADIWLDAMTLWLHRQIKKGKDVALITDVRFANEANFIHDQKGHLLRLIRNSQGDKLSLHESEQDGTTIAADATIDNTNLTLEGLDDKIGRFVKNIITMD